MKRFTETNKWRDKWYRRLSQTSKLLWIWLTDNCDNAGVIDIDLESATFDIGKPVNLNHLTEVESRLKKLPNGKFWIVKFVEFQYGKTLSERCTPHLRIIALLRSHNIRYPEDADESTTLVTTLEPTHKKGRGIEEEEDKEEDKEEGVQGEADLKPKDILKAKLCGWFNRRLSTPWSDKEEWVIIAVASCGFGRFQIRGGSRWT